MWLGGSEEMERRVPMTETLFEYDHVLMRSEYASIFEYTKNGGNSPTNCPRLFSIPLF